MNDEQRVENTDQNESDVAAAVPMSVRSFACISLFLSVALLLHAGLCLYWNPFIVRLCVSLPCLILVILGLRLRTGWFLWALLALIFYNPFFPFDYLPETQRWCSVICSVVFFISAQSTYKLKLGDSTEELNSFLIPRLMVSIIPMMYITQFYFWSCEQDVAQIHKYFADGKKQLAFDSCHAMLYDRHGVVAQCRKIEDIFDQALQCASQALNDGDRDYALKFVELVKSIILTSPQSLNSAQFLDASKLLWKLGEKTRALSVLSIGRKELQKDYDYLNESALFFSFGELPRARQTAQEALSKIEQPIDEFYVDDMVILSIGLSRILEKEGLTDQSISVLKSALSQCEVSSARVCVQKRVLEELSRRYEAKGLMTEALAAERQVSSLKNSGEAGHGDDDLERPKPFDVIFEPEEEETDVNYSED
ncbi:hypothetical protein KF728_09755 [Candidatus Obscuribacterales bacterium]|nr:hypothetical protein [Candidatus Obscuribacterales bacterium]